MRNIRLLLLGIVVVMCCAVPGYADPETGRLSTDPVVGSTNGCGLRPGRTCFYAFSDTVNPNTKAFRIGSSSDICLNSDTVSNTDSSAEVKIWRVINDPTSKFGSMDPTAATTAVLTFADHDCFNADTGSYWLEITVNPSSGKTAVISITTRH